SGRQETRISGGHRAGGKRFETNRSDHLIDDGPRTAGTGDSQRQPAAPYRSGKRHDRVGREPADETIHGNEKNDAPGEQVRYAVAAQPNAQPLSLKEKEEDER